MEKFIPYDKLSKKKQSELNKQKRGTWGVLNPVTRKPENPNAYNRRKTRKWTDDSINVSSFYLYFRCLLRLRDLCPIQKLSLIEIN